MATASYAAGQTSRNRDSTLSSTTSSTTPGSQQGMKLDYLADMQLFQGNKMKTEVVFCCSCKVHVSNKTC